MLGSDGAGGAAQGQANDPGCHAQSELESRALLAVGQLGQVSSNQSVEGSAMDTHRKDLEMPAPSAPAPEKPGADAPSHCGSTDLSPDPPTATPATPIIVAALFVEAKGCYKGVAGVDPWDADRDARRYKGPHPVVAHPPCTRWGVFWPGGPAWHGEKKHLGDDDGCFAHALWSVRTFGGVIEHPAKSLAVDWFGLPRPPAIGWGWSAADRYGGRTCRLHQGAYGFRALKPTMLYAVLPSYPQLQWASGPTETDCQHLSRHQRRQTPEPFRDALIAMARSAVGWQR